MTTGADLALVGAEVLPAQPGVGENELLGLGAFKDANHNVLIEMMRGSQDGCDEDVEKAVHVRLNARVKVPQRMMQPGRQLQRDAVRTSGVQHEGNVCGCRK